MSIQNHLNNFSKLTLCFEKKSVNLEIIEINDDENVIYYPQMTYVSLGQVQFMQLLNKLHGFDYNPYCYTKTNNNVLTIRAIYSWYLFGGCKKLAAFQNNKLISMRVLTYYKGSLLKDKNVFYDKNVKIWLSSNSTHQRTNGILLNIFGRQFEYIFKPNS